MHGVFITKSLLIKDLTCKIIVFEKRNQNNVCVLKLSNHMLIPSFTYFAFRKQTVTIAS